jgi:hypothetical protein
MSLPTSDSAALERLPTNPLVHVVGAGPVGLLLTALLQSMEGVSVRLYEKRREYTRTRMVQLAPYLVADSVEGYRADSIDGDSVAAIFDPQELDLGLAFRKSIPSDLAALLKSWALGFCPLNFIEHSISNLIDARGLNGVERTDQALSGTPDDLELLHVPPADFKIRCANPDVCLHHLNALVSHHPHLVEAVTPIRDFDLARYSFAENVDVGCLDSLPDLTKMSPTDFEHFVRQLLEASGLEGWTTRRSGASMQWSNRDPLVGGLTIVQAKSYLAVIGIRHIRELVGAMMRKARAGAFSSPHRGLRQDAGSKPSRTIGSSSSTAHASATL